MTPSSLARAMPAPDRRDHKPTQINEHKRSTESRRSEHEPHAMAGRSAAGRSSSRAQ